MLQIIDLSQEIYPGMPVFKGLPEVHMRVHATHDTVLLYTDHYRKYFGTADWGHGPGLSAEATRWLGMQVISAFGVETMSPGIPKVSNREVHHICGEMGFTHYENLVNLYQLIGKGRFRFIGFPLNIRGGTGSPVRAVAVLGEL